MTLEEMIFELDEITDMLECATWPGHDREGIIRTARTALENLLSESRTVS
jgi:hypothetical protein